MTDEWDQANAEYEAVHRELMNIRLAIGHKPWEPPPSDPGFVNPHPVGSSEHERLQAVVLHYRERSARMDALRKRIEELRKARIEADLAKLGAQR